jgi:hypothetical protein
MKLRSVGILAALFIMTLSMAMAWPKSKKTINLFEPTTVGSVTLRAGEYTIDWNGTGPDVQVSFSRGNKTIATVPATLKAERNPYDCTISQPQESGAPLLVEIQMKDSTLHFAPSDASGLSQ